MPQREYHELMSEENLVPRKPININTFLRKKGILDRWEYQADDVPLLRRVLTRVDIHSCGLCMTIGAGIFVIAGAVARQEAGPAVIISFLLSGIAALIASFSYSEFAARVPACGSTYSYVYVSLGEFMGWMAGWITILEYLGAAAVAHGIANMIIAVEKSIKLDSNMNTRLSEENLNRIIATGLIFFLTFVVLFFGIKGSARFCRVMSITNISTILFICIAGSMAVHPSNWSDFAPKEFKGIVVGAARVFFAYIGFENSSTLATEVKDPKKYMPAGVISTLVMAVTLYMLSSLVITGMVPYDTINSETPFYSAFEEKSWEQTIVGIGALLCMSSTILTILVGLPRILFQMSRDGLLFEVFSRLNRFKVPYVGTVIFGVISCFVAIAPSGTISDMICFGVLLNYSMINMSVIALRFSDTDRKMNKHQIYTLLATLLSCVLVGLSFHCPHYHYVAPICLLPFLICVYFLYRFMPVSSLSQPPAVNSFLTPCVPFLPCVGTLMNIVMAIQLGINPVWQVSLWLAVGSVIYLAYGMRHSRLNFVKSTDQFYY